MTTVNEIIQRIEEFAPPYLAEDWDPIGLAFGSNNQKVTKMMVALDLDANTLKEAQEKDVDFIFTHHPPIFSSLKTLNQEDSRRAEYIEVIKSNIAVYAAHTNIDAAQNGMNEWLAEALSLEKPYEVMDVAYESTYKLLALYTPLEHADQMRAALHKAGAGQVGDYDNVSYTSVGTGRFTPNAEANPTIGMTNQSEQVSEERTEVLVPNHLIGKVIQTVYEVHPYEEPVFHIFDIGKKAKEFGLGRVSTLKRPMTLGHMINRVKEVFDIPYVRYANVDLESKIQKVAILGGSGEKYYRQALEKGADLYITGDVSYHGAQDMIRDGLPFIDAGHYIENIFVEKMTEFLNTWQKENQWGIEVLPATSQVDVFKFK